MTERDRHVPFEKQLGVAFVRDVGTATAEEEQLHHARLLDGSRWRGQAGADECSRCAVTHPLASAISQQPTTTAAAGDLQGDLHDEARRPIEKGGRGAENDADGEAEQMRHDVGLRRGAEPGEQARTRRRAEPRHANSARHAAAARELQSAEGAEAAEDRRRGADRAVGPAVKDGVEEIAGGAGDEQKPEADTRADGAAEGRAEDAAEDGVGGDVSEVGMQRQRGDRAPDLAVDDPLGARRAAQEPDRVAGAPPVTK